MGSDEWGLTLFGGWLRVGTSSGAEDDEWGLTLFGGWLRVGTSSGGAAVSIPVDCVGSSSVAMSGDQPAAFVPAAPRPGVLARAEPSSRRQERRLVRDVQRGSAAALEELFPRGWAGAARAA